MVDVVVALLHLGNVVFDHQDENQQKAIVRNTEPIAKAAELLKIEPEALSKCLLKKTVKYPGQTIEVDHSKDEAMSVQHSLIKSIYSRLFDQIVQRVNKGIALPRKETNQDPADLPTIGLLDIFGFEAADRGNSFEQLCINYANEKL